MLDVEKVTISNVINIKTSVTNHVGLNPDRVMLELAISIRLDSQILNTINE
jgi:hypothetical protein